MRSKKIAATCKLTASTFTDTMVDGVYHRYLPRGNATFFIRRFAVKSSLPNARRIAIAMALPFGIAVPSLSSHAADVVVRVSGIAAPYGEIGCSLYSSSAGFPMDFSSARSEWMKADPGGVACKFERVRPGTYAVAVGHDRNGNRRVDTNFLGLPTEQWGVSRNPRPLLRAPRFDEATFVVPTDDAAVQLDVTVAK